MQFWIIQLELIVLVGKAKFMKSIMKNLATQILISWEEQHPLVLLS